MASFTRTNGKWKVYVARRGVRKSATFKTKAEAQEWAARTESLILSNKVSSIPNKTFLDLMNRYLEIVSIQKKSYSRDVQTVRTISKLPLAKVNLRELDERHISAWRDARLERVKTNTVCREYATLKHACSIAVNEWRWLDRNPCNNVKQQKGKNTRDRRISEHEIEKILFVCRYSEDKEIKTHTDQLAVAFLFALETAMRLGEICSLTWDNVNLEERTAFLPETKNGTSRTVPLSSRAVALLRKLPHSDDRCFSASPKVMSSLFVTYKKQADIKDLHFHDTRHEAITRLSKKLEVLELARMVGHRDLKSLMIYYNPTASELARKLD